MDYETAFRKTYELPSLTSNFVLANKILILDS